MSVKIDRNDMFVILGVLLLGDIRIESIFK